MLPTLLIIYCKHSPLLISPITYRFLQTKQILEFFIFFCQKIPLSSYNSYTYLYSFYVNDLLFIIHLKAKDMNNAF
jgi:hypothetical protein